MCHFTNIHTGTQRDAIFEELALLALVAFLAFFLMQVLGFSGTVSLNTLPAASPRVSKGTRWHIPTKITQGGFIKELLTKGQLGKGHQQRTRQLHRPGETELLPTLSPEEETSTRSGS